ncbi:chromosomal replication initiator protein DnaA [Geobacter pelophilus]|uniref:Chromosomal replication initiator protein DnaA n=1 Tax=Geoanaerobacter pelophilus TaxID=60036 RepID=A0AAW4L687_9BACT|nr:chromosomal replication initiator protein DnaA [Geoanaerobacter pelophilus]MBT0665067.1 chromosomal replication initiator protein DnaA [Geoanaerobacter pelophilus]
MEKIWQEVQFNISKVMTPQTFNAWIKPIRFQSVQGDYLILEVPDSFSREFIKEKYSGIISEAMTALTSTSYSLEFALQEKRDPIPETPVPAPEAGIDSNVNKAKSEKEADFQTFLNPKYTFEKFVCGSSNQFAYAASQAVANNPATNYNPLFIYGGVGLGKTHLLIAIGNQILASNSSARICYYTSEKFMNEMINSLRHKKMDEFRNKFRKADVLLIDDIQFMANKPATQEEFFHTFNSLYESHKQIVLTSDKFPKEIPDLEERLRSRFEWGLIADIQPPDTETKSAILKKKAEFDGIMLPDDVALFLSSSSASNVRELEGMLVRLGAYSSLTNSKITLTMAREVLKDIIVDKSKDISIESIQKTVADHFQLKVSDLKSDKRIKTLVVPRQIAIYICRELTKASYPEIGEKFGGKDHSTVIHSVKKIEKLFAQDNEIRNTIDFIKRSLLS